MIIVHHLETSRSTRILWLLEELGIEYELHRHARVNGRAPENLKHIHPLGKAPFIVDGDLVLAESSAILRYVDARYGNGRHSPRQALPKVRCMTSGSIWPKGPPASRCCCHCWAG